MMKTLIYATASVLAFAATANVAAADPKTEKGSTTSQPAKARPSEQKYCIVDTLTGSRIQQKTCKTRSEWLAQGFDPLNR